MNNNQNPRGKAPLTNENYENPRDKEQSKSRDDLNEENESTDSKNKNY